MGRFGPKFHPLLLLRTYSRQPHHFCLRSLLLLVATGTELNRRRFTGLGRAAHRRLKPRRHPPLLLSLELSSLQPAELGLGVKQTDGGRYYATVTVDQPALVLSLSLRLVVSGRRVVKSSTRMWLPCELVTAGGPPLLLLTPSLSRC